MLSDTLNTNEVKGIAGTELEFTRLSIADRRTEFAQVNESPSAPRRLTIAHQQSGAGLTQRRRSVVRIDRTSVSTVDSATPVTTSAYIVVDAPIGALVATTEIAEAIANLLSFCATTGSGTTVLFDGTGNGAAALIQGSL